MVIKSYRELVVWQKAMDLVVLSYPLSGKLPRNETFGLGSQLQRASVSVPANIAEGHGREHLGEYLHCLSIANGSLMEVETHMTLLERLSYVSKDELEPAFALTSEVGRLLAGLSNSLKKIQTSE